MREYMTSENYSTSTVSFEKYLSGIFLRMGIALMITAVTSYGIFTGISSNSAIGNFFSSPVVLFGSIILQLVIAVAFRAVMFKLSAGVCEALLYGYAFLTGITASSWFFAYDLGTIFWAFGYTAVMFVCCGVIGKVTKADLTKFRWYLFAGLVTLLIISIVSVFIPSLRNNIVVTYAGVVLFLLYTAYDVQVIRNNYEMVKYNEEIADKFASFGAFELYLDFINLLIRILQILGRSKSRD